MIEVCEEMQKFRKLLDDKKIEWYDDSVEINNDDFICRTHFEYNGHKISVINGFGTYGGYYGANFPSITKEQNLGLLEAMVYEHELAGWLNHEEAWKFIEKETD